MMFGLFGSKKPQAISLEGLVAKYAAHQKVVGGLARAQSLDKLGRKDEAAACRSDTRDFAISYARLHRSDKQAQILLALYYIGVGETASADDLLSDLLARPDLNLSDDEKLAIGGELQALRRHRPAAQRSDKAPRGFTQVYCCAECGRLHNFLSLPCPECDWYPVNIREVAEGVILSTMQMDIPMLLSIGRRISSGKEPSKIIANLDDFVKQYLADPVKNQMIQRVFAIAQEDAERNSRSLSALRKCANCGERITFSGSDSCEHCGDLIDWPLFLRALLCIDSLLFLFEGRIEPSDQPEFSELVCVLVFMANLMLRKQEYPAVEHRKYALDLLQKLTALSDLGKGAVVSTQDIDSLQIYVIKDQMREDSQIYAQILAGELQLFIQHMRTAATL